MTGRIREYCQRLLGFLRGRRPDHDLDAEFAADFEIAVEENLRSGMTPAEARRAAAVRFGSLTSAREQVGNQRGLPGLESLFRDLAYGLRGMRKNPALTGVVVLTLALGIGANTALFSLVEAVLLRPLPVRDPQSLYFVVNAGARGENGAPPYPCFEMFRDRAQSFEAMAAYAPDYLNLTIDGGVEQVWGERASGTYFEMLGVHAALGRVLTAADDRLEPPAAVLNYSYWQTRFGGDPAVIGKTVSIGQRLFTIAGVAEAGFTGLTPGHRSGITIPFTAQDPELLRSVSWFFDIVARLKPGVEPGAARAELEPIFQSYMEPLVDLSPEMRRDFLAHMELDPAARGSGTLRGRFAEPLMILMVIVGIVLLVGCSNLANLFLARASSREREFAVRLAIGAGRWRLARQLLIETMLLFGSGATAGLLLAVWGSRLLAGFLAVGRTPLFIEPHLDAGVLTFTAAIALLTGLLFGVVPSLAAVRKNSLSALHGSGARTTDSRARTAMRQTLVVAQVALSLTLLVGGGLFIRTLVNLHDVDLGFRPQGVLTMSVLPVGESYSEDRLDAFWPELLRRVGQVPGVERAAVSVLTPLSGRDRGVRLRVAGFEDQAITQNHVSEEYFDTFGVALLAGRSFTAADREGAPPVAILNEAAARFYFGEKNPLGTTIELGSGERHRVCEIVGVVGDARHRSVRQQTPRFLYIPIAQRRERLERLTLAIRTAGDPAALAAPVEREVHAAGPGILISEVMTLHQQVDAALVQERLLSTVGGFFGALALLLSAVGLYGLLSHIVGQRTAEIGIRVALGADRGDVVWMILRRSLRLVAIGVALGIPAALLAARPLQSLLYGLAASDPVTIAAGVIALTATAVLAAYLPARRASGIDPMTALRNE
jgi:putative ABC transport system permease protein